MLFSFYKNQMGWIRGARGAEPPAPFSLCRILDVPTLYGLYFWLAIKKTEKEQPLPQFVLSPFTKQTAYAPKKQMLL